MTLDELVIVPLMPSGVEHLNLNRTAHFRGDVIVPLMPSGVEHGMLLLQGCRDEQ